MRNVVFSQGEVINEHKLEAFEKYPRFYRRMYGGNGGGSMYVEDVFK